MKFFLISTLALAGTILASPVAVEEKRQNTLVNTVGTIVNNLNTAVGTSTTNINNLVSGVNQNVGASLSVVGGVNANLAAIATALQQAATGLVGATTGAAGGITGALSGLTQAQLQQVVSSLVTAQNLIKNIAITTNLTVTNLAPAALVAVQGEITQVLAAVQPFLNPLTGFATAVSQAQATVGLSVSGLSAALSGILGIVGDLLQSLLG